MPGPKTQRSLHQQYRIRRPVVQGKNPIFGDNSIGWQPLPPDLAGLTIEINYSYGNQLHGFSFESSCEFTASLIFSNRRTRNV